MAPDLPPRKDVYTLGEALRWKAQSLADQHKTEYDRVFRILQRTVHDRRLRPIGRGLTDQVTVENGIFLHPSLADALEHLPTERALRLFETANLHQLAQKQDAIGYLTYQLFKPPPFTPFYTTEELRRLLIRFIPHLEINRSSLIETGLKRRDFHQSPWLDWHLSDLCFVKYPFRIDGFRHKRRWVWLDTQYTYYWASRLVGYPGTPASFNIGLWSVFSWPRWGPLRMRPQHEDYPHGADVESLLAAQEQFQRKTGAYCDYEKAALLPGLAKDQAVRVEHLRPQLLDLKIAVLERIIEALRDGEQVSLWQDCRDFINEALTPRDVALLLRLDRLCLGFDGLAGVPAVRNPAYLPGGLANIVHVITHCVSEIEIGAISRTKNRISGLTSARSLRSYYQCVGERWQADLDHYLGEFIRMDRESDAFIRLLRDGIVRDVRQDSVRASSKMRKAKVVVVMIQSNLAEMRRIRTEEPTARTRGVISAVFKRSTDGWILQWKSKRQLHLSGKFTGSNGMQHLAYVLKHRNKPCSPADLLKDSGDEKRLEELKSVDDVLDDQAMREIRQKLADLVSEIEDAERRNDLAALEILREHRRALLDEANNAMAPGWRTKRFKNRRDRTWDMIRKRLDRAIGSITALEQDMGEHLSATVARKSQFTYLPSKCDYEVRWSLD